MCEQKLGAAAGLNGRSPALPGKGGASDQPGFGLVTGAAGLFAVPAVSQPEHVPDAGRQSSLGRRASRLQASGLWLSWSTTHRCR